MKHLLTNIKHEFQDYLRAWEQSNPELLEFAIRLALCIGTGIIGGIVVGFILWSAKIGFGLAVALACAMMLFVRD